MSDDQKDGDPKEGGVRPLEPASATMAPGFLARIGLAIVRPRWAFVVANDRRVSGRSGSDLIALIAIVLAATQLRGLVGAVWLGGAIDAGLGVRAVTQLLTRAVSIDLGFLVLAALILWVGAGPKRNLGRAFDLACVAAIPLLLLDLGAIVVSRALDAPLPPIASWLVASAKWGWSGALIALAWRPARIALPAAPQPPRELVRTARRAGWVVAGVAVLGAALHVAWIAQNLDYVRPVDDGTPAPAFSLAKIGARGSAGERVSLAKGRVTVLDFWATWCGPCLRTMPKLDALAAKYDDVDVIAVNLDDAEQARALFDQRGWHEMILVGDDGDASQLYGVSTIPHTVVIDREGVVRHVARGASNIEPAVRAALGLPSSK